MPVLPGACAKLACLLLRLSCVTSDVKFLLLLVLIDSATSSLWWKQDNDPNTTMVYFAFTKHCADWLWGGGGGDDSGQSGSTSSVNAGREQTVNETDSFTLTALGDPAGGTFAWRQLSGTAVTGMPASTAAVTLTAPAVKADSILVFQVTYTTPAGQNLTDETQVLVKAENKGPVAVLQITQPSILPVAQGLTVSISAASSYDLDADGSIAAYQWSQTSGPEVTLTGAETRDP